MRCSFFIAMSLSLTLLYGCAGSYGHVEKVEMEAKAAPEVRGASGYQEPNTSSIRFSANVYMGKSQKEYIKGIKNPKGSCSGMENCNGFDKINVKESVDAVYKVTAPYASGTFQYLGKASALLWSAGANIQDGLHGFAALGINTKYVEAGLSLGLWLYYRHFEYSGTEYYCFSFDNDKEIQTSPFSDESTIDLSITTGGFISAYFDQFSLNYSLNVYRPNPSYLVSTNELQADFDLPLIFTSYITAGYRINKNWEVRMGAVNITGDFPGAHWRGVANLSAYIK